jgi:hypothetical protein
MRMPSKKILVELGKKALRACDDADRPLGKQMTALTRDELLVLLIEECGEVIQAATKCLRFGYDVDHGTGYGNNRNALAKGAGELSAIIGELRLGNISHFSEGYETKIERAQVAKAKYGRVSALISEESK